MRGRLGREGGERAGGAVAGWRRGSGRWTSAGRRRGPRWRCRPIGWSSCPGSRRGGSRTTMPYLLTATDFAPLRDEPAAMDGILAVVQAALVAHHQGAVHQGRLVDRRPGEFEGIRLSLLAGDGYPSGMRI